MKKKKVFLASSNELKEERESFAKFIREINEILKLQNIELEAEQWEFMDKAIQGRRIQDMYNETLAKCEICIVLFWSKCGKYSQEELEFAYNKFRDGLNPRKIFVFFKIDDSKKITKNLIEFKENFPNRFNENFPLEYRNIDELRFTLLLHITRYYCDETVKLKFNNQLIDFSKLPCFKNNKEYSEVLESYKRALVNCEKYPDDKLFQSDKESQEEKLNDILSKLIATAKMVDDFSFNGNEAIYSDVNKAVIHYYQQCQYDEVRKIIEKINNPFAISGDIKKEFFCDRIESGKNIEKRLLNGENIVLVAPRHSGKTTFIKNRIEASSSLKKTHYIVYCDLYMTKNIAEFASNLTNSIIRDVVRPNENTWKLILNTIKSLSASFYMDTDGSSVLSLSISEPIHDPIETIGQSFESLEKLDKPCVICFDEFQSVKNDKSGRIERLVYEYMNKLNNVHFVFIGNPRYYSELPALGISHSIIENSTFFLLDPIKKEDYLIFAQHWFKAYSKELSESAFFLVYNYCQESPYYIQRVLHRLFIETEHGETCQQEKVSVVIDSLIREMVPLFQQILIPLSQTEKLILYYLSEEGFVHDINAFVKKYNTIKAKSAVVWSLFKRLLSNEWISYYNNEFYIENVFFGRYLKTQWSIIQSHDN